MGSSHPGVQVRPSEPGKITWARGARRTAGPNWSGVIPGSTRPRQPPLCASFGLAECGWQWSAVAEGLEVCVVSGRLWEPCEVQSRAGGCSPRPPPLHPALGLSVQMLVPIAGNLSWADGSPGRRLVRNGLHLRPWEGVTPMHPMAGPGGDESVPGNGVPATCHNSCAPPAGEGHT